MREMRGSLWFYRLYDVAQDIDLAAAEKILALYKPVSRMRLSKVRPRALEIKNPPLTVELEGTEVALNGKTYRVAASARLYDFGVLSILFKLELPPDMSYEELRSLAVAAGEASSLSPWFAACRDELIRQLKPALTGDGFTGFVEDFLIFFFQDWPCDWDPVPLLLGEEEPISQAMRQEVLRNLFSYSDDQIIITWDAAFIYDPSGSTDVADLLEFANAQLLELRYYDSVLDRELAAMYDALEEAGRGGYRRLRQYRNIMRRLMELMVEITEVTGRIENALKVTQDIFYVRIYTAALKIFRVEEWLESIDRKMQVVERNYSLLSDELITHRFMMIDIAIVVLIAFEIILWLFTLK
ncbi:hypothetical protein DXX99_02395 [Ammonifex thiophilus]|uniref:DUF155 domain-containing protein n=2 Tax=Ammonifex thiophilus TaxID=444093 RepID=A0A3D8P613_9THEO|nr:hypothetical protein DXX99_02395 [Ammonifex thiophilus]